jgi:hypothetical protein
MKLKKQEESHRSKWQKSPVVTPAKDFDAPMTPVLSENWGNVGRVARGVTSKSLAPR